MTDPLLENLLLIVCVLIYLGYLAVRFSRRLRLPVVTSFLILGMALGPEGLDLVNAPVIRSLRFVEPIALGMITFAAGEQLRFAEIRVLSGRHYLSVGLETVLPFALVGTGAWLLTGRLEVALPVGAIACTTGLATVMSTLKESGAKGDYAKLLGFAMASDNFFAILAFSLFLPLAVGMETGEAIGALYTERLLGMTASVAIGFIAGLMVARLIKHVRSSQELSMFVLAHVLLVIGVTQYFGFSVLLAGLTMGATAVNLTREVRDRDRAFAALGTLEFPIIAIFFLWAGASLHIRALAGIGLLFALYVVARAVGKLAGPLATAWAVRRQESESRRFVGMGVSLLPQAGAAVGLGILARDTLPSSGQTILATVLAAVVVFELLGPMGVHWAARYVGEANATPESHPLTLNEAIQALTTRKARIVVIADSAAPASGLEVPRTLASKLEADLQILPVVDGRRSGATEKVTAQRPLDYPADGSETTLLLDGQHVGRLLDLVKGYAPDILFISLPKEMRRLLGPADALAERLGFPVFDTSGSKGHRWSQIAPPGVAELQRIIKSFRPSGRRSGRRGSGNT
ncbi:MAG: cation:proton antiporter [bacterium]